MATYARKLRYGAHDGEAGANYMALIELARKKGGPPVGFVLYRRVVQYYLKGEDQTEMIRLDAVSADEAVKRFWPWYPHDEECGKEFPGFQSDRWEKTTLWLDFVAAGGGYESCGYEYATNDRPARPGRWVKVGTPAPWKRRHKKKPLRFGFPPHIALKLRLEAEVITEEISSLRSKQVDLEVCVSDDEESGVDPDVPERYRQEHEEIEGQINALDDERRLIRERICLLVKAMRAEVREKFPKPLGKTPKRDLRREGH